MKKEKLIPPDPNRCQAMFRRTYSFMSLGIPPYERCTAKPVWIATERKPSEKGGPRGSMSLCAEHAKVMQLKLGKDAAVLKPVRSMALARRVQTLERQLEKLKAEKG